MKTECNSRIAFPKPRVLIGFALYAAGLVLAFGPFSGAVAGDNAAAELSQSVPAHAPGRWKVTGDLGTARYLHKATLLPNGQVLAVGGLGSNNPFEVFASAELYDPMIGMWTETGNMSTKRWLHTATLLLNGQVLVAGGDTSPGYLASVELYDPATGMWTETGSMSTPRERHTATLLPNGQVLVAGGVSPTLSSAELYDPATGVWMSTGSMTMARSRHTATLLPNGKVLVAAGSSDVTGGNLTSAELYDPATGVWTATGSLATARSSHTATLLPNGQVLVAAGDSAQGVLRSAEL